MPEDYKLSIIIPHYNSPDLLEKLLLTIPGEKEIQTIVVDDHSSEIVKLELQRIQNHFADRNILFIENNTEEHNAGASRNIGLKLAKGQWLLFADADDYFLNGFYDKVKKYFDTGYDLVFFSPTSQQLDTGGPDLRHLNYCDLVEQYLVKPSLKTEIHLRYIFASPWSKLIRASVVQKNQITFDEVLAANDAMFSAKVGFYADKITADRGTIYCITRGAGSLTTKLSLNVFEIRTQETIKKYQFLRTHLTKKEFRMSESCMTAITQLILILRRRYGIRVLFQYLRKFRQNKIHLFNIRIFSFYNLRRGMRWLRAERTIKKRYE